MDGIRNLTLTLETLAKHQPEQLVISTFRNRKLKLKLLPTKCIGYIHNPTLEIFVMYKLEGKADFEKKKFILATTSEMHGLH